MVLQALSIFLLSVAWLILAGTCTIPNTPCCRTLPYIMSLLCNETTVGIRYQRHSNTSNTVPEYTRNIQSHTARLLHCNECPPISTNIHHTKLSGSAKVQTTNRKQNTIRKWKANAEAFVMVLSAIVLFWFRDFCKYGSKCRNNTRNSRVA